MKKMKLYVVKEEDYNEIDAIFSSLEQAEAYIKRFPDMGSGKLEIEEQELDPIFLSFTDKSPYNVVFFQNGELREATPSPHRESRALNEEVEIFSWTTVLNTLEIDVFAKNRKEAIKKAQLIKERVIQKGEWSITT
jgi:hypothetical protein